MVGGRARRVLESGAVAVIVGDGFFARMKSFELMAFRGIPCVICDEHRSLFGYLFVWASFIRLAPTQSKRLIAEQLSYLADGYSDSSCFLFFGREKYRTLFKTVPEEIEARFIIP